ADPPADEIRIVSLGGSTMHGMPYDPKFGIPNVIAWRLQQQYPQRRVISENHALDGQNLQLAIETLNRVHYRPHVLLLYSGHNEFFHDLQELTGPDSRLKGATDVILQWSPTFRLLNMQLRRHMVLQAMKSQSIRELVDQPLAPPAVLERRRLRFHRLLE